jgi:imidazolonepropionase-like amidohydrolase
MNALMMLASLTAVPLVIDNAQLEIGDGTTAAATSVLVDQGKILGVGKFNVPPQAEHVDGRGKVLTPGLIESFTRLGLADVELEPAANDEALADHVFTPDLRAADSFNPNSIRIPIEREEGITSAIVSPGGEIICGLASWVDLTGRQDAAPDPNRPLAMFGQVGQAAAQAAGGARGGTWMMLRQIFDDVHFYAQNRAAYLRGQSRPLLLAPTQIEALLPVASGALILVLTANRTSDIVAAMRFAKEQRIRLVIAGGAEAWRVAKELSARKIPVILTPSVQAPQTFETLAARDDSPALLHRDGVMVVISTGEGDNQNIRRLRQEAGTAVAYGLPHAAALAAITGNPAAVFGRGAEVGTLSSGKRANLVLWSGDPLETTTVAEKIWIDGVAQSLDNRQRTLVRRYLSTKVP